MGAESTSNLCRRTETCRRRRVQHDLRNELEVLLHDSVHDDLENDAEARLNAQAERRTTLPGRAPVASPSSNVTSPDWTVVR